MTGHELRELVAVMVMAISLAPLLVAVVVALGWLYDRTTRDK